MKTHARKYVLPSTHMGHWSQACQLFSHVPKLIPCKFPCIILNYRNNHTKNCCEQRNQNSVSRLLFRNHKTLNTNVSFSFLVQLKMIDSYKIIVCFYFLIFETKYNCNFFSFLCLPFQTSNLYFPTLLQIYNSHFIACYCVCVCVPKYNPFGPYNVILRLTIWQWRT